MVGQQREMGEGVRERRKRKHKKRGDIFVGELVMLTQSNKVFLVQPMH